MGPCFQAVCAKQRWSGDEAQRKVLTVFRNSFRVSGRLSSPLQPARIIGLNPPDAPAADKGYTPGIHAEGQRLGSVSGQGPRDYNADMEIR